MSSLSETSTRVLGATAAGPLVGVDPGRRLGRYELGRLLGAGGQGQVYEAVLHGPGGFRKPVALKLLRRNTDALAREARLGGLLRHPNLVDVYEVGEVDGTWFAAMELCRGGSLDDLPRPLPPRAVVDVGLAVCSALTYAHETLGLVHRDLKPQNLLLDGATVKVADLGIALAEGFPTDPHHVSGTRGFMSAEQRRGKSLDARSDVFALGVVLHVLATGEMPGEAPTVVVEDDSTVDLVAFVPDGLAPIIDRCLRADPRDRYGSMAELAAELRKAEAPGDSLAAVVGAQVALPTAEVEGESALIGRGADLAELQRATAEPGLVVLKGPGGVGKSRLARELVRRRRDAGRRAVLVELGGVDQPDDLSKRTALALEVSVGRAGGDAALASVGRALAALGPVLVVLDGLDHLPDTGPALARWVAAAPELSLVVTTRTRPDLPAVVLELDVPPLAEAVDLLRARALERGVVVDGDDACLERIALRLDRLPLALELAAARFGVLTPAEVEERLSLSWLRSGRVDGTETLQSALEWSVEQCSEDERRALAQLTVFRGGFTLEAAEAVLRVGGAWVVERVAALVDRSLVRATEHQRFALLAPVAELARGSLVGAEAEAARDRHLAHVASLDLATVEREARVPAVASRLLLDRENWTAAVDHALSRGRPAEATRALMLVGFASRRRGPFEEALRLAERVWAMPGVSDTDRGNAAGIAGTATRLMGRFDEARAWFERGWAAAEAAGDRIGLSSHAGNLGLVARDLVDHDETHRWLARALVLARETHDPVREVLTLVHLGTWERDVGRPEAARERYEDALGRVERLGDRYLVGMVQGQYGVLDAQCGRKAEAIHRMKVSLQVHEAFGDQLNIGHSLGNLGTTLGESDPVAALGYLQRALASHRSLGHPRGQALVLQELGIVHERLGNLNEALSHHQEALVHLVRVQDRLGISESEEAVERLQRSIG